MMKINKISVLALFLFMFLSLDAQKQRDWIELGDQATSVGDHYGARHYYENALEMDSTKAELQYKYAETLRKINDYSGAERQYDKVYNKDRGRFYPKGIFWIAKMNEYVGNYEKSIEFWNKYRASSDDDRNDPVMKKIIAQRIKSCDWAIENLKNKTDSINLEKEVLNAGRKINSAESEFGVAAIGDSVLYYSSLRGDYNEDDVLLDKTYDIRIYKSKLKRKFNRFTSGKLISEEVNIPEMITANGSFNSEYSIFFFSQCDQDRNCIIMAADYKDEKFSNVRKLGPKINTPNSSCTQPSIADFGNREVLFFSSNRPGGEGNFDIWFCNLNIDKADGEVKNMGSQINTPDNEITPYFDTEANGLYFSSDWHEGFGGFDIFYSGGLPLQYTLNPKNMLAPYNSSANDMYYINYGETGFITSNRKGSIGERGETCCNDIWKFQNKMTKEDSLLLVENDRLAEENSVGGENGNNTNENLTNLDEIDPEDRILPEIVSLEDLSKYLPITLYFDNDYPDPKTIKTTTKKSYSQTYDRYFNLKAEYIQQIPKSDDGKMRMEKTEALESFFKNNLKKGNDDLIFFCRMIERELQKGRKIELAVKGYASPLSNSDYNKNLTLRRIRSLVNELSTWNNGALLPYIQSDGSKIGQLKFKEIPYGESKASSTVSDQTDNRANSVYSAGAALERRIEILEVGKVGE